jgi:hypothetical protein
MPPSKIAYRHGDWKMTTELADASADAGTPAVHPPLSQWRRLFYIFFAPSKTFIDIRRSASWWLPFLITVLVGYGFTYTVTREIGWRTVVETSLRRSVKEQERMAELTPPRATALKNGMMSTIKYIAYAAPIVSLVLAVVISALLLATLNFGFGGRAKFGQMMAVYFYATFPVNLKYLLAILVIAFLSPDQFVLQNPIGSNLGFYLSPETPGWWMALATQIGLFTLWGLILFSMGSAIVARLKPRQGAAAVVGWWILMVIGLTLGGLAR